MLVCPDCDATQFKIVAKIELGADDRNDEHALQLLQCASCGVSAIGEYEESRRGSSDRVHHGGYHIDKATLDSLNEVMSDGASEAIERSFRPHMTGDKHFSIIYRAPENLMVQTGRETPGENGTTPFIAFRFVAMAVLFVALIVVLVLQLGS
jgi:hypothetical protein